MTKSGQVKHGDLCLAIQAAKPGAGLRLATCGNSQLTVSTALTSLLDKLGPDAIFTCVHTTILSSANPIQSPNSATQFDSSDS